MNSGTCPSASRDTEPVTRQNHSRYSTLSRILRMSRRTRHGGAYIGSIRAARTAQAGAHGAAVSFSFTPTR